jgi:hypothetical protein
MVRKVFIFPLHVCTMLAIFTKLVNVMVDDIKTTMGHHQHTTEGIEMTDEEFGQMLRKLEILEEFYPCFQTLLKDHTK